MLMKKTHSEGTKKDAASTKHFGSNTIWLNNPMAINKYNLFSRTTQFNYLKNINSSESAKFDRLSDATFKDKQKTKGWRVAMHLIFC